MVAAGKGWRNAVDLHHLPGGTHSLAPRPGPLARLAFLKMVRGRYRQNASEGEVTSPRRVFFGPVGLPYSRKKKVSENTSIRRSPFGRRR